MLTIGSAQIKQDSVKVEKLDEVVLSDSRFALKREILVKSSQKSPPKN